MKSEDDKIIDAIRKAIQHAQKAQYEAKFLVLFVTKGEWAAHVGTEWPGDESDPDNVRFRIVVTDSGNGPEAEVSAIDLSDVRIN